MAVPAPPIARRGHSLAYAFDPARHPLREERDVSIAYRAIGEGDRDLLFVHGAAGNLEAEAEDPEYARFMNRLGSFASLIASKAR